MKDQQEWTDDDPRVWRITLKSAVAGLGVKPFEVLAVYYKQEGDFLVFKDNAHKAVYTVAASQVSEIVRLRTDVILAISKESLEDIIAGLHCQAQELLACQDLERHTGDPLNMSGRDWDADVKRVTEQAAGLERLRDVAEYRRGEDPYSLPRTR